MTVTTHDAGKPHRPVRGPWSIVRLLRRRAVKPRMAGCERSLFGREHIDIEVETIAGVRAIVGCLVDAHFQDRELELLSGLRDLRSLTLFLCGIPAESQITDGGLFHLLKLPKLRRLKLAGCKRVGNAGFAPVGQLRRLRALETDHMGHITDEAVKHLRGLTALRQLSLDGTAITGAGLARLDGLCQLRELSLAGNPIANVALRQIHRFPELRCLRLSSTESRITDAGLAGVRHHPRLEEICLWNNPLIRGSGLSHLASLPNLKRLFLRWTPIEEKFLSHLADFPRLEVLDLEATRIGDRAVDHLIRLANLRKLYLAETGISGRALRRLAALSKLRYLTVPSQARPDDLRFLRHSLPRLEVGA